MVVKLKQYLILLPILFITACQPQNSFNSEYSELEDSHSPNEQEAKEIMREVYVTAIETDSNLGNAAAYRGILNVKDNCLFIDDMLIVIQTPYLKWQQDPFVIHNESNSDEMRIGDMVEVGGSSSKSSLLDSEDIKWEYPPNTNCKSQRVWLVSNMVH